MNNTHYPLISVLMSVFNGENIVHFAIESILNQTYSNLEFIIINDGSTDRTLSILNKYKSLDSRIVILNKNTNVGLTKCLNEGIKLCNGSFIARQDSDDVSFPERFEVQLKLSKNYSVIFSKSISCDNKIVPNKIFDFFDYNVSSSLL